MASVRSSSLRAYEFACHNASCAPPPVGSGGSGGRSGRPVRPNPIGPGAGRNPNQAMINKTIKEAEGKNARRMSAAETNAPYGTVKGSQLKRGDRIYFAQSIKEVSSVGKPGRNGRIGVAFTSGGVTDVHPDQPLSRAPAAKVVKTKSLPKGNPGQYKTKPNPESRLRRARKAGVAWDATKPWTEAVGSKSWIERG